MGRGTLGWDFSDGGVGADGVVFGLLLDLLHEGVEGEEVRFASLEHRLLWLGLGSEGGGGGTRNSITFGTMCGYGYGY